jgi:hypothetical protein
LVIVTDGGTVAAAVFVLTKLTTKSVPKLAGIPTVPVEAVAPAFSATLLVARTRVRAGWVTVPLTATFAVVTFVAATVTLAEANVPAAVLAAIRTEIVVAATVPLTWVNVLLEA